MKPNDSQPDPLDELFVAPPPPTKGDLAERTLARINAQADLPGEAAFDDELDAMLEAQEVVTSQGFADRVMAEIEPFATESNEAEKVVGFPSWMVALGGIAAATVLGMFAFITLFQHAYDQNAAQDTPVADNTSSVTPPPAVVSVNEIYIPANEAEVIEYEQVLVMDDALADALLLADLETLDALNAFFN